MCTRFIVLLFTLFSVASITSCSSKSDEEFREEERLKMKEFISEDQVLYYKGMKTFARYAIAKNHNKTNLPYQQEFSKLETSHLMAVAEQLTSPVDSTREVDVLDEAVNYYQAYQEYSKIKDLLKRVDEDSLPTFSELMLDSSASDLLLFFGGQDVRSTEHLILGSVIYLPQTLPQSLTLYELYKVDTKKLGENDLRALAQSLRGVMYSQYKFPYLAEWEHSDILEMLEKKSFASFLVKSSIPYVGKSKVTATERTRLEFHAINLAGRAVSRMGMDRDDKKELAMDDCEAFLKDADQLGWDNELVWTVGTYVAIRNEDKDKALMYLRKLEKSELIDSETRLVVQKSIEYIEQRDPEKAFVGLSDKAFMAKLSLSLALHALEKSGIVKDLYDSGSDKFKDFNDKLTKQSESVKKIFKADQLNEQKDELLNKAKNLL